MRRDRERQLRVHEMMKHEFIEFNGAKKNQKLKNIQESNHIKRQERYNHFPFTYGEQLE